MQSNREALRAARAAFRQSIFERDEGVCQICGQLVDPEDFHIDHVVARSEGGADALDNLQLAHPLCNIRKGPVKGRGRKDIPLDDIRTSALEVTEIYQQLQSAIEVRNGHILAAVGAGVSQVDVASAAGLSQQRINQLVYDQTEDDNGTH